MIQVTPLKSYCCGESGGGYYILCNTHPVNIQKWSKNRQHSEALRSRFLAQIKNPLHKTERVCELVGEIYAARTTLPAWKPFGPFSRSNSPVSPSFIER